MSPTKKNLSDTIGTRAEQNPPLALQPVLYRGLFSGDDSDILICCNPGEIEKIAARFNHRLGREQFFEWVDLYHDHELGQRQPTPPVNRPLVVAGEKSLRIAEQLATRGVLFFRFLERPVNQFYPAEANYRQTFVGEIAQLSRLFTDIESQMTLASLIKFRETGTEGFLRIAYYREYEHPLVQAEPGDFVISAGIGDGYTSLRFARKVGEHGYVLGFEPSPVFQKEIAERIKKYGFDQQIEIIQKGLWKENASLPFASANLSSASVISAEEDLGADEAADCQVPLTALDFLLREGKIKRCDLIKMDIEGAELCALQGAQDTIRRFRPKLQISLYHRPTDLFTIPAFIKTLVPEYEFFLGHHAARPVETVLYARVPVN